MSRRINKIFRTIIMFMILILIILIGYILTDKYIIKNDDIFAQIENEGGILTADDKEKEDLATNKIMHPSYEDIKTSDAQITDNKNYEIMEKPYGKIQLGLNKNMVYGSEYMEGTSHNYDAKEYAYQTKDINNYILNPSTYTGDERIVFLTFDDGPSLKNTPQILDILEKNGVHGTFFVLGTSIEKKGAGDILLRQISSGHSVGYHSYSHVYSHLYPSGVVNVDNVIGEIEKEEKLIREVTGIDNFSSKVFRYPGGHMSWANVDALDDALAQRGIYSVDWNALTGDAESYAEGRSLETPIQHMINDIKNYGYPKIVVVLMHDTKDVNIPYIQEIIDYFKTQEYKFGILE